MEFDEFKTQHQQMYPNLIPEMSAVIDEYPPFVKLLAVLIFIAGSIISGVHTVSTMRLTMIESLVISEGLKDIAALAGYIGFEGALFASVFGWLRKDKRWLAYASTVVVFTVIVMANIQDIQRAAQDGLQSAIIVIGMGVGIPLTALFSGKLLVDVYQSRRVQNARAQAKYKEALIEYDSLVVKAWEKYRKDQTKNKPNVHSQPFTECSVNERQPSTGYSKNMSSREVIQEYFRQHPDEIEDSLTKLRERIQQATGQNVGRTSVHNVRSELQSTSSNGHANGQH